MVRFFTLLLGALLAFGCPNDKLRKTLPPDVVVDEFSQKSASKVDVLWVVDNSGSMEERQTNLAKNFQAFIDVFSRSAIDFRIAITTTDIFKDQGQFRGTPRVLTPSTPDVLGAFAKNIRVGIQGSPYEAGLEAARMALERQAQANAPKLQQVESCKIGCASSLNPTPCRAACPDKYPVEFLRPEAYLYLIFVTDEEDKSSEDVRFFWRTFETAQGIGNDGTVTTAAIIGDVPTNPCGATPGKRYQSLSELTGGEVGSICDASFEKTLHKLATSAVGLKRKFALSRAPNVDTLQVTVLYPCEVSAEVVKPCASVDRSACNQENEDARVRCTLPSGGTDGWAYEAGNNVVYFAGESVPGLNALVQVQYYEEGKGP